MPETVFRISFFAFPLIGTYVALRAARRCRPVPAFGMIAVMVPGVCVLLCGAMIAVSLWMPPQVPEAEIGPFQLSWFLCTLGLAQLTGLGVGAVLLADGRNRAKSSGAEGDRDSR
jgi:hypothetical protein